MSSGCLGSNPGSVMKPVMNNEPVTLTFMLPQTHFKSFLKESIRQFEEQENVKINVQVIPDNQWINMIKTKVFTNETPDIIRIDKSVMMQIGVDRFEELNESEPWMKRVIPAELDSKKIDGKVYGLPVSSNSTIGIVYNKKLFSENGLKIPRSIDELREVCQKFKELGVIPLYASDKDSWTTQTWFTSAAPQVAPEGTWEKLMTNRLHWSDIEEFTRVLNDMVSLRASGFTNSDYMIATYTSAVDIMSRDMAAMYVSGHFFINDVLGKNSDIELGMAPMVYDDVITEIESQGMFSIFKNSEHIELSKTFLNWFSQAENMDVFTRGWGYKPIFNDQKVALPEWLELLNRDYIRPGKMVPHVDSRLVGVDFVDFWGYQQELVVGDLTTKETLQKWDEAYAKQMKNRRLPGWVE